MGWINLKTKKIEDEEVAKRTKAAEKKSPAEVAGTDL